MSENPPSPSPKKEMIAPQRESFEEDLKGEIFGPEHNYGEACLWLAPRDPRCIYAYWDFRPEEHPHAAGADGRPRFYLRIFREENAESTVEIERGAGGVFIPGCSPDSAYFAELGFYACDVWCFFVRSGEIRTPPELAGMGEPALFATLPARLSLGRMREVLAQSGLPGENLAEIAARIQDGARESESWTVEQTRHFAEILGVDAEDSGQATDAADLARRIRRKLDTAAGASASCGAIPAPASCAVESSPAAGWPTSPGAETSR